MSRRCALPGCPNTLTTADSRVRYCCIMHSHEGHRLKVRQYTAERGVKRRQAPRERCRICGDELREQPGLRAGRKRQYCNKPDCFHKRKKLANEKYRKPATPTAAPAPT